MANTIEINRAPVLILWAAVVAEQLGFDADAALTLGKALAGLNAQTKGRRLGIFQPPKLAKGEKPKKSGVGEALWIELCGRGIPAKNTPAGIRAVVKDKPIDPASVQRYLDKAFGDHLSAVREAMTELARSLDVESLAAAAFQLYEAFRPAIDPGVRGWGQKGVLDLSKIRALRPKR